MSKGRGHNALMAVVCLSVWS